MTGLSNIDNIVEDTDIEDKITIDISQIGLRQAYPGYDLLLYPRDVAEYIRRRNTLNFYAR